MSRVRKISDLKLNPNKSSIDNFLSKFAQTPSRPTPSARPRPSVIPPKAAPIPVKSPIQPIIEQVKPEEDDYSDIPVEKLDYQYDYEPKVDYSWKVLFETPEEAFRKAKIRWDLIKDVNEKTSKDDIGEGRILERDRQRITSELNKKKDEYLKSIGIPGGLEYIERKYPNGLSYFLNTFVIPRYENEANTEISEDQSDLEMEKWLRLIFKNNKNFTEEELIAGKNIVSDIKATRTDSDTVKNIDWNKFNEIIKTISIIKNKLISLKNPRSKNKNKYIDKAVDFADKILSLVGKNKYGKSILDSIPEDKILEKIKIIDMINSFMFYYNLFDYELSSDEKISSIVGNFENGVENITNNENYIYLSNLLKVIEKVKEFEKLSKVDILGFGKTIGDIQNISDSISNFCNILISEKTKLVNLVYGNEPSDIENIEENSIENIEENSIETEFSLFDLESTLIDFKNLLSRLSISSIFTNAGLSDSAYLEISAISKKLIQEIENTINNIKNYKQSSPVVYVDELSKELQNIISIGSEIKYSILKNIEKITYNPEKMEIEVYKDIYEEIVKNGGDLPKERISEMYKNIGSYVQRILEAAYGDEYGLAATQLDEEDIYRGKSAVGTRYISDLYYEIKNLLENVNKNSIDNIVLREKIKNNNNNIKENISSFSDTVSEDMPTGYTPEGSSVLDLDENIKEKKLKFDKASLDGLFTFSFDRSGKITKRGN